MGLWDEMFGNKQKQFDTVTQNMFNEITLLAELLDSNNGKMSYNDFLKAQDSIVDFIRFYRNHRFSIKHVLWLGGKTTYQFVIEAVYGFVNDVERKTGHRFTRLNEPR